MKYIYDIILNFNETKIYDFFEWHPDDDIEYFKKVPLLKISNKTYKKIAIGAKINDDLLLNSIYNATEIYDNKKIRYVEYAVILT
ncbi:MAG: hypothetical protein PHE29_12705, partial [Tissierellia bacterium]|nr:hypothetical protein [Tissierellia bacterium]